MGRPCSRPHSLPVCASAAHPVALAATTAAAAAASAGHVTPVAAAAATAASNASLLGLTAGQIFGAVSGIMVPVYLLMAFATSSKLTRSALLTSSALYIGLALLYVGVLVVACQWEGLVGTLGSIASSVYHTCVQVHASNPTGGMAAAAAALDLSPVARLFADPWVTLLAWVHLLALDVLMAREIALDGLRAGVATGHSVLLCFFFGPTGLLSHAITRLVMGRGRA